MHAAFVLAGLGTMLLGPILPLARRALAPRRLATRPAAPLAVLRRHPGRQPPHRGAYAAGADDRPARRRSRLHRLCPRAGPGRRLRQPLRRRLRRRAAPSPRSTSSPARATRSTAPPRSRGSTFPGASARCSRRFPAAWLASRFALTHSPADLLCRLFCSCSPFILFLQARSATTPKTAPPRLPPQASASPVASSSTSPRCCSFLWRPGNLPQRLAHHLRPALRQKLARPQRVHHGPVPLRRHRRPRRGGPAAQAHAANPRCSASPWCSPPPSQRRSRSPTRPALIATAAVLLGVCLAPIFPATFAIVSRHPPHAAAGRHHPGRFRPGRRVAAVADGRRLHPQRLAATRACAARGRRPACWPCWLLTFLQPSATTGFPPRPIPLA